jgi:hypothetical protein
LPLYYSLHRQKKRCPRKNNVLSFRHTVSPQI